MCQTLFETFLSPLDLRRWSHLRPSPELAQLALLIQQQIDHLKQCRRRDVVISFDFVSFCFSKTNLGARSNQTLLAYRPPEKELPAASNMAFL
jgi:hypothetical protein